MGSKLTVPWAMNEYGQSRYCRGPGCRCEDMDKDTAHRLNYEERMRGCGRVPFLGYMTAMECAIPAAPNTEADHA